MHKAVALTGGGLKSAVVLASQRERYTIHPLFVDFGDRSAPIQRRALEKLCKSLGTDEPTVLELPNLAAFIPHPHFDPHAPHPHLNEMAGISPEYVAGRMPLLLAAAAMHATRHGAKLILVGLCESPTGGGDKDRGHPDHTREFVQVYNDLLAAMMPRTTPQTLHAPFIDYSYVEIVRLGHRLGVPFQLTWSCHRAGSAPCGECEGCQTRWRAFQRANLPDPALEPARGR